MFSDVEITYLRTQRLARLATVATTSQPTVDAVGYQFDGARLYIGGINLAASRKYRNVASGNHQVALIIDDLETIEPWMPRGIKIHGTVKITSGMDGTSEIMSNDGPFDRGPFLAIAPRISWSWGIVGDTFQDGKFVTNKNVWAAGGQ